MKQNSRNRGVQATAEGIEKLEAAKIEKRWSYDKLATEAQLSRDTVDRIIAREAVDKESIRKIAKALDLQSADIVAAQEWNPSPKKTVAKRTSNTPDWQKVCCDRLKAREQQRLTTNPLTGGDGMKYELDEIHVPLGLVERKQRPKIGNEVLPQRGVQPSEYEIGKKFEYGEFLDQVLSKQRQSHANKKTRLAIIGEAGAGKTTLLQKIAVWVFEAQTQVAIWVSLADLQGKTLEEYLLQIGLRKL
jgi:predicted NACHT family NTPase